MASWREIEQFRKDVAKAKALAERLLALYSDFSDWEIDFLESLAALDARHELTTRQVEKLLEIRDDAELVTEIRGFSVRLLIKNVHEARLDLNDADEKWISRIRLSYEASIRRKHAGRLIKCAYALNIIEEAVD